MKTIMTSMCLVLLVALAGCSGEPTPTQVAPVVEKVGPPAEAGVIMRGSVAVGLTWIDVDSGLRVVLGADMDEYCAGIVNFDLVDFQDAHLPGGRIVTNVNGAVQATVWDFLDFDCAMFTSTDPVAEGTAVLRGVDNDVQGTVVRNTNTWGWMSRGMLTAPDGTDVRFSGFIRQQFGNDSGPKVLSSINLR